MAKFLGNVLLIFVAGCLVFAVLSLMGVLPYQFITIPDSSMAPTYSPGDLAITRMADPLNTRPGDVICFHMAGKQILHRVVQVADAGIVTRGDANSEPDPEIVTEPEGKVVLVIPGAGYAMANLRESFEFIPNTIDRVIENLLPAS
jgi:signal peptidase